ncbi:Uncharacterised protein g434 [Pycnogonum litorale]
MTGPKKRILPRPILRSAICTDLQNGSYTASVYSVVLSLFALALAIFDMYCLGMAYPGSVHISYHSMSFIFVYSGNSHVRNVLILCAALTALVSIVLLVVSVILMVGLRREHEQNFRPWLWTMGTFTVWRFIATFIVSIANDLYFTYHDLMLFFWIVFLSINVFCLLVVYSNYQELEDITRLEDMAKLKMGTMSSLNTSHSMSHHSVSLHSWPNSRPHTPHGSSSTATA